VAREVWSFPVLIPKGTLKATPQITDIGMPPRIISELEVRVPPGPRGEVGFALGAAKGFILPLTPGQFIVTDDEIIHWPLEEQISSGAWQLIAYNTGLFDHTLTVRFLVGLPDGGAGPIGFAPIATDALDSVLTSTP
jgi:hypothetical protein